MTWWCIEGIGYSKVTMQCSTWRCWFGRVHVASNNKSECHILNQDQGKVAFKGGEVMEGWMIYWLGSQSGADMKLREDYN